MLVGKWEIFFSTVIMNKMMDKGCHIVISAVSWHPYHGVFYYVVYIIKPFSKDKLCNWGSPVSTLLGKMY